MDISKFIDSKAIRNYLSEIGYKFTPVEMAFIIWQSKYKSINQKHRAWKWIVENCDNIKFVNSCNLSLHEALLKYMSIDNKLFEIVKQRDNNANYEVYYPYDTTSVTKCEKTFKDYNCCLNISELSIYEKIYIQKKFRGDNRKGIEVWLQKGKIMGVLQHGILSDEDTQILSIFEECYIEIPTPFKKGDILTYQNHLPYCQVYNKQIPFIFVLDSLCYWENENENNCAYDMWANGFCTSNLNCEILFRKMYNYLALDYYYGKLNDINKSLKLLSDYLKGKIDIAKLLNEIR